MTNKHSDSVRSLAVVREWLAFVLALLGSILGLMGFLEARKSESTTNKIKVDNLVQEARDLLGGGKEGVVAVKVNMQVSRNNIELARRKIDEAKTLDPNNAKVFNVEGIYFISLGDSHQDEAIAAFGSAIKLDPNWEMPHNNLAVIYQKQGNLDGAAAELKEAVKLNSVNAQPQNGICYVLWKKGQLEEAVKYCKRAIELDPKYDLPYENLVDILQAQGKAEEALKWKQKLAEFKQ